MIKAGFTQHQEQMYFIKLIDGKGKEENLVNKYRRHFSHARNFPK
jgi:hypothetical protein